MRRGNRPGPGVARVTPPLPCRVCSVRSVDGSPTTAFTVLECEGSRRLGSRPRRYLLTGQANGSLAMWDLTTAMDGLGQAPGTPRPTSILSQASQTHPEPLSISSFVPLSLLKPLPSDPFLCPPDPPCPYCLTPLSFPPLSLDLCIFSPDRNPCTSPFPLPCNLFLVS